MLEVADKMPEKGQFVVIWENNGRLWSTILQGRDGELYEFSDEHDEFRPTRYKEFFLSRENIYYFTWKD